MRFDTTAAAITGGFVLLPKLVAALDRLAEPREESSSETLEMIQTTNDAIANAIATIDELQALNASNAVEYDKLAAAYDEIKKMSSFVADCSEVYRVEAERLTKENIRLVIENKQYESCCEKMNDKIFDLKYELGYEDF